MLFVQPQPINGLPNDRHASSFYQIHVEASRNIYLCTANKDFMVHIGIITKG